MDEFEIELKQSFLEEAGQSLDEAEEAYLSLESDPENADLLNVIFRSAHNIKGTSRAVGFGEVAEFVHIVEDLILKLKEGQITPNPEIISLLLKCNDRLRTIFEDLKEDLEATFDNSDLVDRLQACTESGGASEGGEASETVAEATPEPEPVSTPEPEPVVEAVAEEKKELTIEEALALGEAQDKAKAEAEAAAPAPEEKKELTIEEALALGEAQDKAKAEAEAAKAKEAPAPAPAAEKAKPAAAKDKEKKAAAGDETIRVSLGRLDKLNNFVGELVILHNVLSQNSQELDGQLMSKSLGQLGKISKEIHEITMSLRMLPIRPVLKKMQRIVRDTSGALNKKVNLEIIGEETEVDKTVLEYIADPLVHIVRNAVDHGLESTEGRLEAGKSEVGNVALRCFHEGNNLVIEVQDDGKGIPPDIIRKKAIEKGVIRSTDTLSDDEVIQLIFHPGFSTKEQVSEVSGRGVGMDVVKTNIQELSGEVLVESEIGKGSVFRIVLPLTMAIIDGMVAQIGDQKYVFPLTQVQEFVTLDDSKIDHSSLTAEILNLRGESIPLIRLRSLIGKVVEANTAEDQLAVIVNRGKDTLAIAIDDIINQQQVVVKNLGDEVTKKMGIMGSSILGDGMPALIIDLYEVVAEAKKTYLKNYKRKEKKEPKKMMEAS